MLTDAALFVSQLVKRERSLDAPASVVLRRDQLTDGLHGDAGGQERGIDVPGDEISLNLQRVKVDQAILPVLLLHPLVVEALAGAEQCPIILEDFAGTLVRAGVLRNAERPAPERGLGQPRRQGV